MITVPVSLGDRSYDVVIGPGARHRLLEVMPVGVRRAAVVTQRGIDVAVDTGVEQRTFLMGDGESAKDLETVEELCRQFSRWGLTRADAIVAVGGGVVTDTVGFAAAVYHRGLPVVHVATSLLAQVDAAIGGKTGVNLPEGKNLVGAFWQPAAVLCDTEVLETLPPREYRSGLGEMAKYAFLGVERLPDLALDEAVAACVRCKAAIVAADERESGVARRPQLRPHVGPRPRDGRRLRPAPRRGGGHRADVRGPPRPARRSHRRSPRRRAPRGRRRLRPAGQAAPGAARQVDELVDLMARDKKAVAGHTFVLDGPRGVEVVHDIERDDVVAALKELM